MDFFADNLVKHIIYDIITNQDRIPSNEIMWFNMTKSMLKNYPTIEVFNRFQQALEEVSDEQWFENKYPKEIFIERFVNPKKEKTRIKKDRISKHKNQNGITARITAHISIIGIADKYNLKPLGKNKRICPFHADKDPSLSLNDEKGLFNCFGCKAHGNIIDFIYLLRKNNSKGVKP